ncbi:MAG TPA: glycosyltransferase family 4 protein [Ignavibacteria bacterium]|nr:glycosyltransferase family 4 protein [Ignavibacteria bacterium]
MKLAVLSPVAWRTPPRHYGPWEQVASNICEGMVGEGIDVTLFATKDSITQAKLEAVVEKGYAEDSTVNAKVVECLHISHLMEMSDSFDLIHNNFDYLPLTYSRLIKTPMLTTIHGFSSPSIIPVFKKYDATNHYVSISNSDRSSELNYLATVYNGVKEESFELNPEGGDYLLFFSRIHPEKGTYESIQIAKKSKKKLIISGIIQDENYFNEKVKPYINGDDIIYIGSSGPEKRNKLLGNALALLHPISFEEPFGLSVVESMFCGTPVIAFDLGSMPELIEDTKTGFIVNNIDEASEALKQIKNLDRKYISRYSRNKFSVSRMIKEYLKVYKTILE